MAAVACRSEVRVERIQGTLRRAWLPGDSGPVMFGAHGAIAAHYKLAPGSFDPPDATAGYIVAAAVG